MTGGRLDGALGVGPTLLQPRGIEALPDGTLLVTDADLNVIPRVDPATGDRAVFSGVGNYWRSTVGATPTASTHFWGPRRHRRSR